MINPITKWLVIGGGVLVIALGTTITIQTLRLDKANALLTVEKQNTKRAVEAHAASELVRKQLAAYNDELEAARGEALTAQILREKNYADQIQQLLDAERDGKAVPLSDAAREYFERVRREQANRSPDGARGR
jgi:uncharacterized protein YxeA